MTELLAKAWVAVLAIGSAMALVVVTGEAAFALLLVPNLLALAEIIDR